jgi:hypothetical protein
MFERGVDYLCDVLDGKKSFDWSLLFLVAFLIVGSGIVIHGFLFDIAAPTANSFGPSMAYSEEVDGSGAHHCFLLTQQDVYGGYTYELPCGKSYLEAMKDARVLK